jgi:hypothetical protein
MSHFSLILKTIIQLKLTEKILKLSNPKFWESTKSEWNFEYAYYSKELQICLYKYYSTIRKDVIPKKVL